MVRLDTQVQLLLSGRDMLFSPHTVSRCHGNSQAKREHLERKTISLASYSGKHRKNTTWKWIFYNFGFGLKSSHGFVHPVVFLVGSNLTDLASRGWTKVLICVVMYCKDSGFQACGAPRTLGGVGEEVVGCGVGDWWHTFGVFFFVVEGLEASFRVRISLSFFHFWGLAWVEESNLGPMV